MERTPKVIPIPMPACSEALIVELDAEARGAASMEDDGLGSVVVDDDDDAAAASSIEAAEVSTVGDGVTTRVVEVVTVGRSKVDEGGCTDAVVGKTSLEIALVGKTSGMPGGAANVDVGSEKASATLEGCSNAPSVEVVRAGKTMLVVGAISSDTSAIAGTAVEARDMTVSVDGIADGISASSSNCSPSSESPCLPPPPPPPPPPNLAARLSES
jgi:hypothetical protein